MKHLVIQGGKMIKLKNTSSHCSWNVNALFPSKLPIEMERCLGENESEKGWWLPLVAMALDVHGQYMELKLSNSQVKANQNI